MQTCPSCGQENPLGARFCNACAAPLPGAPPALAEERKIVTVLFVDLVGFTARAELLDAVQELNATETDLDLQVRIAVNTGEALVSVAASAAHGEGIVAGDVVNTAARLQSAAPVNGILVGEETYRATRGSID